MYVCQVPADILGVGAQGLTDMGIDVLIELAVCGLDSLDGLGHGIEGLGLTERCLATEARLGHLEDPAGELYPWEANPAASDGRHGPKGLLPYYPGSATVDVEATFHHVLAGELNRNLGIVQDSGVVIEDGLEFGHGRFLGLVQVGKIAREAGGDVSDAGSRAWKGKHDLGFPTVSNRRWNPLGHKGPYILGEQLLCDAHQGTTSAGVLYHARMGQGLDQAILIYVKGRVEDIGDAPGLCGGYMTDLTQVLVVDAPHAGPVGVFHHLAGYEPLDLPRYLLNRGEASLDGLEAEVPAPLDRGFDQELLGANYLHDAATNQSAGCVAC